MTQIQLKWFDPNTNQSFEYSGQLPVTIGRVSGNTIVLEGIRVSRSHARIESKDGSVSLTDDGSSNGTVFNGKRIKGETVDLNDGSQFIIDPFEFTISILKSEPAPSPNFDRTVVLGLPSPLNKLSDKESLVIQTFLEEVTLPANSVIFRQGEPTDGCYILDKGLVRLELEHEKSNPDEHEDVLAFVETNTFFGELSLLDRSTRSATAIATTDVSLRKLTVPAMDRLVKEHPAIAVALLTALGRSAAERLRQTTQQLDNLISIKSDPQVEAMIASAEAAQREIMTWTEDRIDSMLQAVAMAFYEKAELLARAAVDETGIGNVADKTLKNHVASMTVLQSLLGKRGFGVLGTGGGVVEVAHPVGIIFGLVPVTNPTSTFIFKTLIAIKSRNALILSPNRRAAKTAHTTGELVRDVLQQCGAPNNLVQWVDGRANRKLTVTFMSHKKIGLILATGGSAMVRAAYSSGNPAIGVGTGNAPTLITASADLSHAAQAIVLSKSFDNGLICGAEHNLVVDQSVLQPFTDALIGQGAAILDETEAADFTAQIMDPKLNGFKEAFIGKDAATIAEAHGIHRSYPIRLIVVPSSEVNADNPYAREKMLPILSLFTVPDVEEGFAVSRRLLSIDGRGHTAIIHTQDEDLMTRFGLEMPASRILVNSPGAHGVVGISTGLVPSLMLGCGTFGGTSTTDNVTYSNLMNVKRVAYFDPQRIAEFLKQ